MRNLFILQKCKRISESHTVGTAWFRWFFSLYNRSRLSRLSCTTCHPRLCANAIPGKRCNTRLSCALLRNNASKYIPAAPSSPERQNSNIGVSNTARYLRIFLEQGRKCEYARADPCVSCLLGVTVYLLLRIGLFRISSPLDRRPTYRNGDATRRCSLRSHALSCRLGCLYHCPLLS
ncbi:hypothetical protein BC628DRAFT_1101429 [Trametes gibbosa]|nr:hypothetical protein BC628DRAFT_1101429 [Trametes gibbosa]